MMKTGINQSLGHLQNLSQFNPQHNSTIDLLYSYESQKAAFSEDTIKRMSLKIKEIREKTIVDSEYE